MAPISAANASKPAAWIGAAAFNPSLAALLLL
jgi:hypothetical protein